MDRWHDKGGLGAEVGSEVWWVIDMSGLFVCLFVCGKALLLVSFN